VSAQAEGPQLVRGLGLLQATALNVANMVGVGPFITIPYFLSAMGGPQALVAFPAAALLVLCDGLIWSELGAALPASGGSYHFLREIFGRYRWGRLLPFLFIWQFLVSGSLELASGYIGGAEYLGYALPHLADAWDGWALKLLAATAAVAVTIALCRSVRGAGWLSVMLCAGTLTALLAVIVVGVPRFDAAALAPTPGAFDVSWVWLVGFGGAMRVAIYDYFGYYNICHLGDEVREPGRTIPQAVIASVLIVTVLYLAMNSTVISVVGWERASKSPHVVSEFMEVSLGRGAALGFTGLVVWTALAGVFAMTLGYSRIPFAAARKGDFFRVFARLHARDRYPVVSLLAIGGLTAAFCFLPLAAVIEATVTVRIFVQFIGQIAALHVLRTTRPDVTLPFRMWLYPLPSLVALAGWTFVLATSGAGFLWGGLGIIAFGCVVYAIWQWRWPRPPLGSAIADS
jgi:amino acid transporter